MNTMDPAGSTIAIIGTEYLVCLIKSESY
jgi:hypothetical protein